MCLGLKLNIHTGMCAIARIGGVGEIRKMV